MRLQISPTCAASEAPRTRHGRRLMSTSCRVGLDNDSPGAGSGRPQKAQKAAAPPSAEDLERRKREREAAMVWLRRYLGQHCFSPPPLLSHTLSAVLSQPTASIHCPCSCDVRRRGCSDRSRRRAPLLVPQQRLQRCARLYLALSTLITPLAECISFTTHDFSHHIGPSAGSRGSSRGRRELSRQAASAGSSARSSAAAAAGGATSCPSPSTAELGP